ncbi:unnamed protein product [Cochlearia groenlandica]
MREVNNIVDGELKPVGSGSNRFEVFDNGWPQDDERHVAKEFDILLDVLWTQSFACFSTYYSYRNGSVSFTSEAELELNDKLLGAAKLVNSDVTGDFSKPSDQCLKWLYSRQKSSVVYIVFGSLAYLKQDEMEEMAQGVLKYGFYRVCV